MKRNTVIHPFEPIFDKNSKVLILGSLPSPKSREINMYYGNPQNRFWKILANIFNVTDLDTNDKKKMFVMGKGIALWDVIYSCEISGASDATIINAVPNDFSIFDNVDIRAVFTVGKTAYNLYKKFTGKDSYYLPSPSGANCAIPFDRLCAEYSKIIEFLQ